MRHAPVPVHFLWLGILTTTCGVVFQTASAQEADYRYLYRVADEKQLFIDELFFEKSQGVALKVHPARKTQEKNIVPDRPWESATLNWFSVADDEGKCRMWYECYDVSGWDGSDDTSFCYAESTDGIHWTKPNLGLFEYQGSKNNNILFRMIGPEGAHSRVHGTGVFKDPHAPANARYKAVSQGIFVGFKPPHRVAGMVSPDGIRWTRYSQPICDIPADSQYSAFWDERLGKYVLYGRVGGHGRSIGRSESADFSHFEPLGLVLQTDEEDPPNSDLYNPAAIKYPYAANVYLMFPSLYQHDSDTLDIRLAVSRDGIHWTWPERVPFVPLGGPGGFDSGSLYMGQGIIRRGSELWQYFSGSPLKHNEAKLENLIKAENRRVYSRIVSRLDGFVSVDAGPEGGFFETPPLTFTGSRLELNVQVRDGGWLRVALLDKTGAPIKGYTAEQCRPVTGDHITAVVGWNGRSDLSGLAGKPIKMRVELRNASLYAFQFAR